MLLVLPELLVRLVQPVTKDLSAHLVLLALPDLLVLLAQWDLKAL